MLHIAFRKINFVDFTKIFLGVEMQYYFHFCSGNTDSLKKVEAIARE